MRKQDLRTVGLLLIVACLAGCATTPRKVIRVNVSESGIASVGGSKVGIPDLARTLKSMGATAGTRIEVTVSADAVASTVLTITRHLAAAGLNRAVYIGPKEAISITDDGKRKRKKKL